CGLWRIGFFFFVFFFQAEDGIRDGHVTGVQTCALPILALGRLRSAEPRLGEPRRAGRQVLWRRWDARARRPADGRRRGVTDALERDARILTRASRVLDQDADLRVQAIHARIGMGPAVREGRGVE